MPDTSEEWIIDLKDETATGDLGRELSLFLRLGDLIALSGDLGAGKTTLARALIRAYCAAADMEVPSPTFALVQPYRSRRGALWHFDLYRVSDPREVDELGLLDAADEGVALVEWPDRIGDDLPEDRLEIRIEDGDGDGRRAALTGFGNWAGRIGRIQAARAFLEAGDWRGCERRFLQGDASARRYERLGKAGRSAVFMDMPPQPDGPPIRDGRPYSAIAHLAEGVRPFVAMAEALRGLGLSAPEILAKDLDRGFLVIEDLGDAVFGSMIEAGADMTEPYASAVDLLVELRGRAIAETVDAGGGTVHRIPPYDGTALQIEADLLLDWFWRRVHGEAASPDVRRAFASEWTLLFDRLSGAEAVWTLRDYHSPNLVWLEGRQGVSRVGLLDFQDAVLGHPAYDLVSLLQDARTTVAPEREAAMLERYCAAAKQADDAFDETDFRAAYAILGAQRATKILGIFVRLADRDGKPDYLRHVPRVSDYLDRDLNHSVVTGLKQWFDENLPAEIRKDL